MLMVGAARLREEPREVLCDLVERLLALERLEVDRLVEVDLLLLLRPLADLEERAVREVLRAITCAL